MESRSGPGPEVVIYTGTLGPTPSAPTLLLSPDSRLGLGILTTFYRSKAQRCCRPSVIKSGFPVLHSSSTPGSGRALNNSWSLLHVLEALIFHGVPAHQRHTMAQSEHYKRCWPNGKDRGGEGTGARRGAPDGHQGTGTTRMVLVNPEPGRHPVSTMTTSPFLKKPRALPTSMAKFTRRSTSSAQAFSTASLHSTGKMPRYRWAWRAVWGFRVTAMIGARGRYLATW